MHTITAEISTPKRTLRTYKWTLPSSVEELKPKHLRRIAFVMAQKGDALELKMRVLMVLARISRPDLLNGQHVTEALKLLDFLDDATVFIEKPIIKRVFIFKTPRRRLLGFTGNQMALCDTILQAIQSKEEIPSKLLAELCAANTTLMGLPWSNRIADYIAIPFFRYFVRRSTKLAILIQYRAMRRIFPKMYENAFSNDGTAERFPSLGWPGTFVRLAGNKFGTPTKVRQTTAHELFTYLEQNRRDEIRMESQRNRPS